MAAAYQSVIDAYSLKAIDIDIEHGEFNNKKTRLRVIEALAVVQRENPGLEISITMGTAESGGNSRLSLAARHARVHGCVSVSPLPHERTHEQSSTAQTVFPEA